MNTEEFSKWLDAFINYERNANKNEDNLKKMRKFAHFFILQAQRERDPFLP